MRHGVSFAEVLDATLRGYQPEPAARQASASFRPGAPVPPNPFLFTIDARAAFVPRPLNVANAVRGGLPSGATAHVSTGVQSSASAPREERTRSAASAPKVAAPLFARPAVVPGPARRKLTSVQQRSLDAFVDAGASIGPDFSADEVRSAYRRLALRLHPDRHPLASDGEKASLARQFAAITTDYDVLLTALDAGSC
jgi:hypothetical protein